MTDACENLSERELAARAAQSDESAFGEPFFQAKVLNAWRKRENMQKPWAGFCRWWQASAAMVFIMLFLISGLISVSCLTTDSNSMVKQTERFDYNLYSADSVILNQKMPKELTDEQALEVLEDAKFNRYKK